MRRTAVSLVLLVALTGACSGATTAPDPAESNGRINLGSGDDDETLAPDETASPLPDVTVSAPPFDGGAPTPPGFEEIELEPQEGSGAEYASKSSAYDEPQPDAETSGVFEKYAEATAIDIKGNGDSFTLNVTFARDLPEEIIEPNSYMFVSFGMSGKEKGKDYPFGAAADAYGWHPYSGGKGDRQPFTGPFSVDGKHLSMTISWDDVGGPRPFTWYCTATWFRYAAAVTSYSFDVIPNDAGRYPK